MHEAENSYLRLRLDQCREALSRNNCEAFVVIDPAEARCRADGSQEEPE